MSEHCVQSRDMVVMALSTHINILLLFFSIFLSGQKNVEGPGKEQIFALSFSLLHSRLSSTCWNRSKSALSREKHIFIFVDCLGSSDP